MKQLKITKCKLCPLVRICKSGQTLYFLHHFLDIYECSVFGRPVNPETRPENCCYPEMHRVSG